MISTVLPPTGGTICIDGISLQEQPAAIKKVMGVVPQEIALYQALSAKDNLAFLEVCTDFPVRNFVNGLMKCWTSSNYRNSEIKGYLSFRAA